MKKILTQIKSLMLIMLTTMVVSTSYGQAPAVGEYRLIVTNEMQTAPNVYEFDIYLLNMSSNEFKLGLVQFGLFINPAIKDGGTLTPSIVPNSSELTVVSQRPTTVQFVNTVNYFNLAAQPIPLSGAEASTISKVNSNCSSPGTRIGTFRLTNTVPFAANSHCNSIFSTAVGSGRTNTVVTAKNGSANVTLTAAASHLPSVAGGTGVCYQNIALNAAVTCNVSGSATTTPATCAGGDGTATVTLTGDGSTGGGFYSLDGGPQVSFLSSPFTITGLDGGNHTVITTQGTCISPEIAFNVAVPAPFTASYTKTNLSACGTANDGTITVTAEGGSGVYNYAWTGVTGSGNPANGPFPNPGNVSSLTNLLRGFYNVTITDANGCGSVTFTDIQIASAFGVYITHNGSNSSGCGNTGTIVLYGNAGVQPYTFSLDGTNYQTNNTFTGLAAATYTASVKDAAGCVFTREILIGAAAPVVVNAIARAATSCANDGSIQVFRTGGIPPYTYSLDDVTYQSSNTFGGLAAGTYTAYVKDSKGCGGSQAVTVTQGASLSVGIAKTPSSTCVDDGTIQVTATGGTAPFQYSIDGGTYGSANSFSGLADGNYVISVQDSKGCLGSANVTIDLNPIVVTATVNNSTTCSSNNGKIQVFRTGGVGPYTYSLDGNTYQASNVFNLLPAGNYTVFVKDSKTCTGMLADVVVGPTGCGGKVTATNSRTMPVKAVVAQQRINAYPNPSMTEFTLLLEGFNPNEKVAITVTDLLGRKVYQTEGLAKIHYRFGRSFLSGMYNVQVVQGAVNQSLKLIKE